MKRASSVARLISVSRVVLALSLASTTGLGQSASSAVNPKVTGFSGELRLGREMVVNVTNLSDWATKHDPQRLVPYLNGRPLKGTYPEQIDLSANTLRFHPQMLPESRPLWSDLFHDPVLRRPVTLSVGLEDQSPFDTIYDSDKRLSLTVIPKALGLLALLIILLAASLFVVLLGTTNIVRVAGPALESGTRRYSLTRLQTALWFFLAATAFVCLWLITGDFDSLTPSVLALIGINAVTTIGTRVVAPKDNGYSRDTLASSGFFPDLLSDATGYSFHRFQMAAWTLMFGIIFIYSVYHKLAMPNFSRGVLALMGISAATFLGFESLQARVFQRIVAAGR